MIEKKLKKEYEKILDWLFKATVREDVELSDFIIEFKDTRGRTIRYRLKDIEYNE